MQVNQINLNEFKLGPIEKKMNKYNFNKYNNSDSNQIDSFTYVLPVVQDADYIVNLGTFKIVKQKPKTLTLEFLNNDYGKNVYEFLYLFEDNLINYIYKNSETLIGTQLSYANLKNLYGSIVSKPYSLDTLPLLNIRCGKHNYSQNNNNIINVVAKIKGILFFKDHFTINIKMYEPKLDNITDNITDTKTRDTNTAYISNHTYCSNDNNNQDSDNDTNLDLDLDTILTTITENITYSEYNNVNSDEILLANSIIQ